MHVHSKSCRHERETVDKSDGVELEKERLGFGFKRKKETQRRCKRSEFSEGVAGPNKSVECVGKKSG